MAPPRLGPTRWFSLSNNFPRFHSERIRALHGESATIAVPAVESHGYRPNTSSTAGQSRHLVESGSGRASLLT